MASGFAAGAGADMLQQVLRRKFEEQIAQRRLEEQIRQADMQNRVQQQQLGQGQQRIGLEGQRLGEDTRQFNVSSGQADERLGMEKDIQPMRIKQITAQTEDLNRQPQEALDARAFREKELGLEGSQRMREIGAQGSNALRVANARGANEPVVRIQTVDAAGNPIIKVLSRSDAAGQDFAASPTTDQRNRQAATARSGSVVKAIAELSERINTGQGAIAKIQGAAEKAKAAANLSDDVSEYQAVVSGFTPLLARAVGHTGVLTEQDVQSVRKMLPDPGDSKSVRDRKITRIESLMGQMSGNTGAAPKGNDPLGIR
jgi:hypothetical protein